MAATSIVIFFYVICILKGMFENRKMRTPIERMFIINFLTHYVKKNCLFYIITGVTFLILLLGGETYNKTDWTMLGNIFGLGIIGIII